MKKLEIHFKGGYRRVSKYLTREHDANFAFILDAIVYIHNENQDNLLKIGNQWAVKISNGFLSSITGLTLDVIKRNVERIEEIGLVTVFKKGQGNTRHYAVNIENINTYIVALKPKFDQWYKKSIETRKKDKARLDSADQEKLQTSQRDFKKVLAHLGIKTEKPINWLDENQPTQKDETNEPKLAKPAVIETYLETSLETTTEDNSVVVQVFNNNDEKGIYYLYEVEGFEKRVYLKEYTEYMENLNELSDKKREELDQQVSDYDFEPQLEDLVFYEDLTPSEIEEELKIEAERKFAWLRKTPIHKIMKTIDRNVESVKRKRKREERRIYETTKEPASSEVSIANWKKLKEAYDNLPNIENQGKFITSKKDLENFKQLSEYKQDRLILFVTEAKNSVKTVSRPQLLIQDALEDKLTPVVQKNQGRINVMI